MLDKLRNPSSLLETAVLAVSSYDLPIDELPQTLKIMLQEGSIETEASKLKEEIEILKDEFRPWIVTFEYLKLVNAQIYE